MKYVYLHGFASSPDSTKARHFAARFAGMGRQLVIPDLAPDFFNLTITSQIAIAGRAAGDDEPVTLIGSSLGGYVAALCAAGDARVSRLVLLAPAFGLAKRWNEALGGDRAEDWRRSGALEVYHYAQRGPRQLGYGFVTDAARYPAYPKIDQPALVLHGRSDTVVPATHSAEFARRNPGTRLVLLDSGHEMTDVLGVLWAETAAFLGLGQSENS
jgi:hypothetical protein